MTAGGSADLEAALLEEVRLRSRLNALVHERAEALREAERLSVRGQMAGADPAVGDIATRWRTVADRVAGEIEEQRSALRAQEAAVEKLRAPEEPG
jgi:hypothetical protein